MTHIETMKLALEEMRRLARLANVDHSENAGVVALEQAIEQAEQAQPVAWRHNKTGMLYDTEKEVPLGDGDEWAEPLYTAPPPRHPWVGLTDEEVINAMPDDNTPISLGEAFSKFADLIEAKLKEKNSD
jgi:hypothetical protein